MNKHYTAKHIFIEDAKDAKFELPSDAVILYSEVTTEKRKVGLKVWYGIPHLADEQIIQAMKEGSVIF
jgi:hypothetical protein